MNTQKNKKKKKKKTSPKGGFHFTFMFLNIMFTGSSSQIESEP